ncbi:MAG: carbon starvation protein A, partial [candidate division Zixibacteria bacterium]|nr:carbon starvation protein A [candidate division Zixibacteria bacterium]
IKFWTLFGSSNQLLAALSLLTITVWLHQSRKRIAFTLLPMLFVLTITLWSLVSLAVSNFRTAQGFDIAAINGIVAAALIILAIFLVTVALIKSWRERKAPTMASM